MYYIVDVIDNIYEHEGDDCIDSIDNIDDVEDIDNKCDRVHVM